MITLYAGGYTKEDIINLSKMLEQNEHARHEQFCKKYSDCHDCPVRKSCADLARLAIHIEGTKGGCA